MREGVSLAAGFRVYRGGDGGSAGTIVGTEASEAQRSDSDLLRLDCEEVETRLSKGRKGALPPVPPVRLCSFPVVQSQGLHTGGLQNKLRCGWNAQSSSQLVNCFDPPHPCLAPPRPERDQLARPRLMRYAYPRWRAARVILLLWGRHADGLTYLCLQEAPACVRNESMSRAGTGMKVARALLLLGVGWLASAGSLSGATAQTCTTGSKAVAIFSGNGRHACALLVSESPPLD